MKGLKAKLMAATAMLAVSATMLAGTSYAWYTLSTNPEVSNISATAVANENLEIALVKELNPNGSIKTTEDSINTESSFNHGEQGSTTGNNYTWGNLITLTNVISGVELRPATSHSTWDSDASAFTSIGPLQAPEYGVDGRASGLVTLVDGKTYQPAVSNVEKAGWVNVYGDGTKLGVDTKYAFRVDYVLRTNTAGNISLSEKVARDTTNGNGSTDSNGSYITQFNDKANSTKVLFKITPQAAGADTWDTASSWWVEANNTAGNGTGEGKNGVDVGNDKLDAVLIGETAPNRAKATENSAYLVQMYVYLNGEVVTNEDAGSSANINVNIQFVNDAITNGAMKK